MEYSSTGSNGCPVCSKLPKTTIQGRGVLYYRDIVTEATAKGKEHKQQREERVLEFLQGMNALLNEGGGAICVHLQRAELLGDFDEQIDAKLTNLIADDSFYHDNFERYFVDEEHVVFRVIPRKRRVHSTWAFNTKVSTNVGLQEPTQFQMQHLVKKVSKPERVSADSEIRLRKPTSFVRGAHVDMKPGVFQEALNIQAKRIPDELREREHGTQTASQQRGVALGKYCWEKTRLYISAFSKVSSGGSVFFGLYEEKTNNNGKEEKTGKYICEGLLLNNTEREKLKSGILCKAKADIKWLSCSDILDPVSVEFHPTEEEKGGDGWYVVEVVVKKLHGVCFYKDWPQSYKLRRSKKVKSGQAEASPKTKDDKKNETLEIAEVGHAKWAKLFLKRKRKEGNEEEVEEEEEEEEEEEDEEQNVRDIRLKEKSPNWSE